MLTPKQKAFADYFIECGNASEAARKAGYSLKTAGSIGAEKQKGTLEKLDSLLKEMHDAAYMDT